MFPKNTFTSKHKLGLRRYFLRIGRTGLVWKIEQGNMDRNIAYALAFLEWEPQFSSLYDGKVEHNRCEQMIANRLIDLFYAVRRERQFSHHSIAYHNHMLRFQEKVELMINHCRQVCWYWGPIFENDYQYINI